MQFFDKSDNRVYVVKIPTKQGRQLFVYYKRYSSHEKLDGIVNTKKTMYQMFQNNAPKKEDNRPTKQQGKLGSISIKTFENPLLKPKEEVHVKTEDEILDNIPSNRTLFIFNFDQDFDEAQIRLCFKTVGKLRYVFVAKQKNNKHLPQGRRLFFALVVFKNERELKICLDHPEILQERINNVYKGLNIKTDDDAKLQYRENLIKNFAADEIKGEKNEFVEKMEQDGFRMVMDFTGGYEKFDRTFGKADSDGEEEKKNPEESFEEAPKKKKKTLVHNDFYRFQVKDHAAMKSMGMSNYKGYKNKANGGFMGEKLQELQKGFQEDLAKLREFRKNKNAVEN